MNGALCCRCWRLRWRLLGIAILAKRQPEYPNGQVIGVFTLLDGGLGGLLIIVFAMVLGALSGHFDMPLFIMIAFIVGGSAIGCLPATLCGLILAWRRCTRSWKSAGLAALMGGVASVLFTLLWASAGVVILCGFVGALAAAILAVLVLLKAE